MQTLTAELVLDRMFRAVSVVRQRLLRSTAALDDAGIPYAVIGDQAVAAWVATIDECAVRNTPDVDLLVRRSDLPAVREILEAAGFQWRSVNGQEMFLEAGSERIRDAVRIFFANERQGLDALLPNPDVEPFILGPPFRVLGLGPLLLMFLASFRTLDRLRIRDLADVGLIDDCWIELMSRASASFVERLRSILANPDG